MNAVKLKILEDTFNKSFDLKQFNRFTKEFFNEPEIFPHRRSEGIWKEYTGHISAYYKIANYSDTDDNKLLVLAVEIKKDKSVERARTMQRNFISKVLDENGFEAAIVAFYNPTELNWRLSFVRLDYSFTDKGLELDLTPAKRYSYLVGELEPNHTVKSQLLPIFGDDNKNPTIDEIEKAFTVEKVTKEFFEQYKEKYIQLKEYLEQDSSFVEETEKLGFEVPKFAEQFAKKLLGQLAFLYFLQKKGWLGVRILPKDRTLLESEFKKIYFQHDEAHRKILDRVFEKVDLDRRKIIAKQLVALNDHEAELFSDCFVNTEHEDEWGAGDKRFISKLFDTCKKSQARNNFFHDFLQPLFYEALNRKRKNHYFNQFNCKVPFLNGGLFEPLEGYHWRDVHFNIPNLIFSNEEEKGRNADGILDIFERYNFTINEDEPLEKEVAVDPEMLGKIFENLLDVKDRKTKGAFYTPREIVHYMCQESLSNYLTNEIGVPYEDMQEFILYGDLIRDTDSRSGVGYNKDLSIKPSIYNNLVKIDKALENVRVADPAVGSGAFPLGMLSEIVRARNNITDYLVLLDKKGMLGRQVGEEIIRKNRSPFLLKWRTIKNSIFAVDIEPSAVDIAKLRLWLSVVVDQEINNETPEPQPLPNLDMNIMVGNSLIDEFEGIKLFDEAVLERKQDYVIEDSSKYNLINEQLNLLVDYSNDMLEEMFKLQDQYFGERIEQNKKDIKERIDKLRDELIEYKLERDGNKVGLMKYNEFKKKKQKPYFLWYLEFAKVFKEKGGFDIVIGNPPYVGEKGNKEIFRPIASTGFGKKYYQGKMDLFYFFFHKALDIGRTNCEIAFITTNYYPTAFGGKKLRTDFKERAMVRKLINFNELKIFETALGQHNLITFICKVLIKEYCAKTCISHRKGVATPNILNQIFSFTDIELEQYSFPQDKLYEGEENYIRLTGASDLEIADSVDNPQQNILNKMIRSKYKFGVICTTKQGIVSGADKVTDKHIREYNGNWIKGDGIFVLNKQEVEALKLSVYEKSLVKKVYKNSNINKYKINDTTDLYVLYITKGINRADIPNIIKHLKVYEPILENKRETIEGKLPWYSLHWARDNQLFEANMKIVNPRRAKGNIFAIDFEKRYEQSDIMISVLNEEFKEIFDMKFLVALLNSKLYSFWLLNKGKLKGTMYELYGMPLSEIPIPELDGTTQGNIVEKVDLILKYNSSEQVEILMEEIDNIIYKIFNLTPNEIELLENKDFYFR